MPRILVVDDDPVIRRLISATLLDEGFEVSGAGNGREALAMLEEEIPDLIVLDLAMPEMDGWHFLEELYDRGLRKRTRVVIVSANLDSRARDRGRGEAIQHFLEKPFEIEALLTMVNEALTQEPDELAVRHDRSDQLVKLIGKVNRVLPASQE